MKKKSVRILIALVVVAAVLTVAYRLMNRVPAPELTAEARVQAILDDGGCLDCHSRTPNLPFYADFPVAGKIVRKDVSEAVKHIDLGDTYRAIAEGKPVGEVALAKIEKSMRDGTMPMAKYYMVHWGSSVTAPKQQIILDWVRSHRARFYPNTLADAGFANEPVQPIADSLPTDPAKVALGHALYNDTRLSSDNSVSCASCHNLQTGGVDNKRYSEGVGGQFGGVNAPTVFNAAYNFVQFWDGRAADLAEQAGGPPLNPVEMASSSWDQIVEKLSADKKFAGAFEAVYPAGLSGETITDAIAEYEKTLLTPDSRFDLYLKGDPTAMTEQEIHGYELFKENRCATCHTGPLLGGQSYERMGLYADYFADRGTALTEEDNGRYKQTQDEYDRHRFKVPGLRNVALTAPYYHDGSQKTLRDAVDHMVRYQAGRPLSESDLGDLTAFLGTLTGRLDGRPLDAPAPQTAD